MFRSYGLCVYTGAEFGGRGEGGSRSAAARRHRHPRHSEGGASAARSLAHNRGTLACGLVFFLWGFMNLCEFELALRAAGAYWIFREVMIDGNDWSLIFRAEIL